MNVKGLSDGFPSPKSAGIALDVNCMECIQYMLYQRQINLPSVALKPQVVTPVHPKQGHQ